MNARRLFLQQAVASAIGAHALTVNGAAAPVASAQERVDLWPSGRIVPPKTMMAERVVERSQDPTVLDRALHHIAQPHLVVFRPSGTSANAPGKSAIVIFPGGGYRWVVIDREGFELARWFAARGIVAFVCFYRVPSDDWPDRPNVAFADAQRAMRIVRARAEEWGIHRDKIAAMGFSAGGHVCADLAVRHAARVGPIEDDIDRQTARPCLAAPLYPVVSMSPPDAHQRSREALLGPNPTAALERAHSPHLHVHRETPPCFLLHAEDDASVPVSNTLLLRDALRAQRVECATHLFARGGHGFGLARAKGLPVEMWPDLFLRWAQTQGWGLPS